MISFTLGTHWNRGLWIPESVRLLPGVEFQPTDRAKPTHKILLKLAAYGKLLLQACIFVTFRKKQLMERRYASQDTNHRPVIQCSAEGMKLVSDRKQKEVTQLLMGRQHSNRWNPLYCRCALYGT